MRWGPQLFSFDPWPMDQPDLGPLRYHEFRRTIMFLCESPDLEYLSQDFGGRECQYFAEIK